MGKAVVGVAGLINPARAERYEVKAPVWAAFLEFDKLARAARTEMTYQPVPRFPKAERDCAVIVDRAVRSGELVQAIREAAPELIEEVDIFDVYTGKPIPDDKKSVAISVAYRGQDRTLTDEQVNKAHTDAINILKNRFDAELR
jgi:phenylalanyl-tRNA synthetase beta chain